GKNVETIDNVIEDESHFVMKVVDNDLGGRSSWESKSACGEVGEVENMSSMGSKLMVRGEEFLEGCVGVSGGEVSGSGDNFEVSKSLLGEIPRVVIGGETFGDDGGALCCTVLSVHPVPFAEWNWLWFLKGSATTAAAENNF
ncbi:hypothetical protein Tco_0641904, partial [Tanacetum coccineum]